MNADHRQLRMLVAERIPADGSDEDTMFSDEEIEDFLIRGALENSDHPVDAAAYYAWRAKAAELANLTNVIEGNSSREMAELHRHATRMMDRFAGYVPTIGRGRAVVGRITRPGVNS